MLKKHYFADVIDLDIGGLRIGSARSSVWLWQSAGKAYDILCDDLKVYSKGRDLKIVEFKRVI